MRAIGICFILNIVAILVSIGLISNVNVDVVMLLVADLTIMLIGVLISALRITLRQYSISAKFTIRLITIGVCIVISLLVMIMDDSEFGKLKIINIAISLICMLTAARSLFLLQKEVATKFSYGLSLIGNCYLLHMVALLVCIGITNDIVIGIPFLLVGLLASLFGLFLLQYKASKLAYWVIIAGAVIAFPTLPISSLLIYFCYIKMINLQDDSDIMTAYGRLFITCIPYLWMLLLFLLPFLIVFKISFADMIRAVPPYTDLISYDDGVLNIALNFGNYFNLIDDTIYINAYLQSLKIACIATFLCILIGYPLAWAISQCKPSTRNILLLLVILPSWTSFLIRVYAWMGILKNNGLLNNFLIWLGVIDQPLIILNTNIAVYIGIVYSYLPFVVLPIYTSLSKVDNTLIEAALDLGCKPLKTFFKIIVPLTKSGIIAGGMLVFIPAVGEYVIPELLGGSDTLMIGKQLWLEFFNNRDWPAAAAVASVMLLILIVPIFYFNKFQNRQMGGK